MRYIVVGTFRRVRKDCEGETQDCENFSEALRVKAEWKKSNKYKKILIAKNEGR